MHRLLKRQIIRYLSEAELQNEAVKSFLGVVNEAYINADQDYRQLELTLELSSKESFRELTNLKSAINTAALVVITDHRGVIQFVNENFERVSGYTASELIGANHSFLKSGYHSNEFFKDMWETISAGNVWKGDVLNKCKDGGFVWLDSTIVPMLNEAGKPNQYITIRKDITNEKNAELAIRSYAADLEKKNSELDQFAYIVSHDLKAPLRAINNLSEWIEEDLGSEITDDVKTHMALLRGRVKRMELLINGILDYSRAGRIKTREEMVDTSLLIDEIISSLAIPRNFKVNLMGVFPVFKIEKLVFEQVLTNYISNAVKYNNNPQPVVSVSCNESDLFYEFCVSDNGPGIDKEFHEKIFVIFQTLQSRDKIESTGVGLAIVKKIVDDKGGRVWLESSPGNGASFFFSWPKPLD
jgi:PAS domain S-box-containing protein